MLAQPIIDAINLNLGVKITDGVRTKLPISTSQKNLQTMSRKEYLGLTQDIKYASTSNLTQSKLEIVPSGLTSRESSFQKLQSARSQNDILANLPDYFDESLDLDESIQKSSNLDTPQIVKTKSPKMKIKKYGDKFEETDELSSIDRFNLDILNNKNWGLNPPFRGAAIPKKLPKKNPSPKKQWELHGDKIKKSKDNPFASSEEL